jgi:sec-independent protein translocase protein TatA
MFGLLEILLVLAVILVLFGGAKLPALSKGIGRMVKNIQYGLRGDDGIKVKQRTTPRQEADENQVE